MSSPAPHRPDLRPDLGPDLRPEVRVRLPRLPQGAVDRARLSVVPRARSTAPRVPFVALVSLVLLTGVVGLLLFNTSMQQASFASTALEQQAAVLSAREQGLRMDLAEQRDPQRVARHAQEMGMVIPTVPAFLKLGSGEVEGDRVAAGDADRFPMEAPQVRNPYASPTPASGEGDQGGPGASAPDARAERDRNEAPGTQERR